MLNTILHGAPTAEPPLLIAHGLYGSARNWGVIAKRLSDTRQVIAVDMRNHGDSPHLATNSYADMAADLAQVIENHGGRADVLGHSMGGKAAMVLALSQPQRVHRLIVADIAPVAYTHSQIEYIDAMRSLDLTRITRRSEADAPLAAHVEDAALRAFLLQSLAIGPEGAKWKLNLETLADYMPEIIGFPDVDGPFEGPTTFLSGGASDYVQPAHHAKIRDLFPNTRFEALPGAGHWLHAEQPRPFEDAVRNAL
ncbi:MAG: alpha/beta fold hydrolase [Pseudomonadota bacterium]